MMEIRGKVNTADCYATVIEDEAIEQIRRMCDYEFTEGSRIRIMPDVHAGRGCTIGTTMTITDRAVPNVVGVDIGPGRTGSGTSGPGGPRHPFRTQCVERTAGSIRPDGPALLPGS